MLDLTLQQLFGKNATQTATTITIYKADFLSLTAEANNRGVQLFVALLLQAQQPFEGVLTDHQNRTITDNQNRPLTYNHRSLYEKLDIWFWRRQFAGYLQSDTFILDVFIRPPTEPETELNPDSLVY